MAWEKKKKKKGEAGEAVTRVSLEGGLADSAPIQRLALQSMRVLLGDSLANLFVSFPCSLGLLVRAYPRRAAAQATPKEIRGNRENVQVRMERLREGLRYPEPPQRARYHAVAWPEAHARRYVTTLMMQIVGSFLWGCTQCGMNVHTVPGGV